MGQSVIKRYVSDQFERTVNNLLLIKYCRCEGRKQCKFFVTM